MGGLGSDVAIENVDDIIQTNQPSKIASVIQIGMLQTKLSGKISDCIWCKSTGVDSWRYGNATMCEAVIADMVWRYGLFYTL